MLLVQWAAAVILIVVLTFFFIKDGEQLRDWTVCLFAEHRRDTLREISERAWSALATYVQGVFLVATLDAVLIGIVLVLVGVPIALPLIVLTFIAAFFPIVGAVMAGAAATLVALVSGGIVDAAIVLAAIIAIQQLEGNVFYPMVVGKQLQLHPVAILLALTAGGVLAGVAGAFLAIPVAAVTSAVLDYVRTRRRRARAARSSLTAVACARMDAAMREYYEQRAPEYDDWWLGTGLFATRERPGWDEDVAALQAALAALAPARTLDVACGTGFLTRHLPGELTGLDQSAGMLEVAAARMPGATFVQGDALDPPFEARRLRARPRRRTSTGTCSPSSGRPFLEVAARLAGELVITDSALRPDGEPEAWQERELNDGSRHRVYKRWFTAAGLAEELGGGETVHAGPWFVAVRLLAPSA